VSQLWLSWKIDCNCSQQKVGLFENKVNDQPSTNMRILLVWLVLLGSLVPGCQNSDLTSKPERGEASPQGNSTGTPAPTTAQTPLSFSKSDPTPSAQAKTQVATISNSPSASQQTCQIRAFVIDKDSNGVQVRSNPSEDSKVIGNLPTNTLGVIVNLSASQGDWVQLTKAESPEKIQFQGTGWVKSQLLGTSTRGYGSQGVSAYASASTQSSAIGRIPARKRVKLLSCDQSWAFVEYEGLQGWISRDDQCPSPLTTCP
jgi:SH3-like domain-containing protein